MAGLLRPKQVSCPADLQIPHGNLKSAAQLGKFPDGMQTFFRNFLQHFVAAVHQEGIGRPIGTADTPAQLIELGKPHLVRVVNDHGIDIGNIQSRLNDGCGHQHVNLTVDKSVHDLFQLPLLHLPMSECHIGVRHKLCDHVGHLHDGLHPVIDIVDLSAPCQFPVDRLAHHLFVVLTDKSLDRDSLVGRFFQNAHIPDSDQTHVHGTGDWRRRQRQDIHVFLHLLDLFLVRHAESLLFVDDQKAQILEDHILGQYPVGSDHDIHQSLFQIRQCLFLLSRRPEPAHQIHAHRKIFHPFNECVVMLLCQDRSRHQINHLLVFLHRLERRPDRHLRLAKAYVSADQAVHDLMALHIFFRGFDGGKLIVRLLEGEHFLKFSLPYRIRSILITFCRLTRRIQFHQILRDIFDRSAHPCLGLVPFLAAKAVQLRLLGGIRRCIFLKGVHLRRQNVQAASARIFNFDIILHHPVYFDLFNSFVDTKSVIFVNHIISNGQF